MKRLLACMALAVGVANADPITDIQYTVEPLPGVIDLGSSNGPLLGALWVRDGTFMGAVFRVNGQQWVSSDASFWQYDGDDFTVGWDGFRLTRSGDHWWMTTPFWASGTGHWTAYVDQYSLPQIPEPATWMLLGSVVLMVTLRRRPVLKIDPVL